MSNKLTDAFDNGKLDYELKHGQKYEFPETLDHAPNSTPIQADIDRKKYLQEKFRLSELQMDGLLGLRLQSKSLAEHLDEIHVARRKENEEKLKVATASFNGKPVKLWYSVGR